MRSLIHHFDAKMTGVIQSSPALMDPLYRVVTTVGHPAVIITLMAVVCVWAYSAHRVRLGVAAVSVVGVIGVNSLLKLLFQRARPASEYVEGMGVQTFSFPSGHSAASMVGFGLLAYLAFKFIPQPYGALVAGMLGLLVVLVGVSRVYLGAHYPSDVLAGWVIGLAGLLLIIFLVRPLS